MNRNSKLLFRTEKRKEESTALRENNFSIVRLIGTVFVFSGHMGLILGGNAPSFAGFDLHGLGVGILFFIGGYLITQSWLSDQNVLRYVVKRFFRIYPAFAVMILIMVFVTGPLLSSLGWQGYFENEFSLYLKNLRFYIVFYQPGVFGDLPIPMATNGSLWTIPVEVALYVITPFLLTIMRVKDHSRNSFYRMVGLTVILCIIDAYFCVHYRDQKVVVYGTDLISAFHLSVLYIVGMLYTYNEMKKILNIQISILLLCFMLLIQNVSKVFQYMVLYTIFPYVVFSMALATKPLFSGLSKRADVSYGLFLYGFFFQQLITSVQQHSRFEFGYAGALLISFAFTLCAALASCYLVERPALKFGKNIQSKIR